MSEERDVSSGLVNFLIFLGLTIITPGIYPMFVWLSHTKEQIAPLGLFPVQARRNGDGWLE